MIWITANCCKNYNGVIVNDVIEDKLTRRRAQVLSPRGAEGNS